MVRRKDETPDEDWNEWLLEDRMNVIDAVLITPHLPYCFIEKASDRDEVLWDMLGKFPDYTPIKNHPTVEVYSSVDSEEKCARYDEKRNLVYFAPLSVVSDEWIDWYLATQVEEDD